MEAWIILLIAVIASVIVFLVMTRQTSRDVKQKNGKRYVDIPMESSRPPYPPVDDLEDLWKPGVEPTDRLSRRPRQGGASARTRESRTDDVSVYTPAAAPSGDESVARSVIDTPPAPSASLIAGGGTYGGGGSSGGWGDSGSSSSSDSGGGGGGE